MAGGGRALALGLVGLMLAVPLVGAAWSEPGGGPTKSYQSPFRVPQAEEVAFRAEVDADIWNCHPMVPCDPIIVGDFVYLATTAGIHRVSIRDGTNNTLVAMEDIRKVHSDGERLFAQTDEAVLGFALDGSPLWVTPFPIVVNAGPAVNWCPGVASGPGVVYYHCRQQSEHVPASPLRSWGDVDSDRILLAFDAATGEVRWLNAFHAQAPPQQDLTSLVEDGFGNFPMPIAVVAGKVVASSVDDFSKDGLVRRSLTAHDATTGELKWHIPATEKARSDDPFPGLGPYCRPWVPNVDFMQTSGRRQGPLASGGAVFALLEDLVRVRVETGVVEMELPFDEGLHNARFAVEGSGLVNAWATTLQRFDQDGKATLLHQMDGGKMWHWVGTAEGAVVGLAHDMSVAFPCNGGDGEPGRRNWLNVFLDDGRHWTHELRTNMGEVAIGDGVIVITAHPRTLIVLGRTEASIAPWFSTSGAYPGVGERVTVDMAKTRPGLYATDLEYRVDWGDNTVSEWQTTPALHHIYAAAGDHVANLTVRNSAGQQSIERVVFHVGGTPPVAPNFLERAFATENQDRTFFIMGGAATGTVALFGLLVAHRRRSILQRELKAVDATRGSADADRLLDAAQTRATMLYRERRLDEAQFAVLREHIDQARNAARMHSFDAIASHLPHGVVLALRQVLADGRVNAWEEQHVLSLLPPDLPPHVVGAVRETLARWRQHDTQDAWGRA